MEQETELEMSGVDEEDVRIANVWNRVNICSELKATGILHPVDDPERIALANLLGLPVSEITPGDICALTFIDSLLG